MANFHNIVLRLQPSWCPTVQCLRFRRRINIQRPVHPHYVRDKVLHVCQPIFPEIKPIAVPSAQLCRKQSENNKILVKIDNPYEKIIAKDLFNWFNHSNMVAFFHTNSMSAEDYFKANIAFKKQNMTIKIYGRKTAQLALQDTKYEAVLQLFQSQNSMVFSTEPQVAKLLRITKKIPQLILMAGIVEGRLLSKNELVEYSRLPDLQTARASLVSVLNLAANQVIQHLNYHPSMVVGHLNQYIELQQKEQTEPTQDKPTQAKESDIIGVELQEKVDNEVVEEPKEVK